MREIKFRVWHHQEKKMYYRGYQKISHVLLCRDDEGSNEGKGIPVKDESFEVCEMLETASIVDVSGKEVFEGDIVRLTNAGRTVVDVVDPIPDMFKSRGLHPLQSLLNKHAVEGNGLQIEVLGNKFENPELDPNS